ncbi:putative zinc-binding oxidoreductase ToxD [Neohortaea acidophila]|uniref:Putative zinc-binding oxidoreductase ToxD n=1 Tax=Neohortaea acidophila TaxID=245834 RepID=A0A6A6Q797_9PEZI|nr:putative zinc-binding oxidoreductase ToxD [Neohortaea acidophila]KAF2487513.1 putative zinc-binding oxidoreductase ToxD [Neohortaea acidophila]
MPPQTMKAIKIVSRGKAEIQDVPVPRLRDDYVLVKVKCVALNPTDWKHRDSEALSTPGCTLGCDYAGVVEEVGSKVTKEWKKGAGFCHGGNAVEPEDGVFGEYCVAKGDVQLRIPDNTSFEEACTLGVGVITCGQALYQSLELPLPGSGKSAGYPLLIYGASTATGSLALQYALHSGCSPIIAVCSPRNFPFVKALGATEAFDYNDPKCGEKIRAYTNNTLTKALDCIAEGASPAICCAAISSQGGEISYLLKVKHDREDVVNKWTLGYTVVGEAFKFGPAEMPAKPEDFEFTKGFVDVSTRLLASSQISVHPAQVGKGGLQGVLEGLELLKAGKVSGVKLVYKVDETT